MHMCTSFMWNYIRRGSSPYFVDGLLIHTTSIFFMIKFGHAFTIIFISKLYENIMNRYLEELWIEKQRGVIFC